MNTPLDIILTRPAKESSLWIEGFERAGHRAVNWPLIDIQPIKLDIHQTQILGEVNTYAALVFVSPSAVEHFFKSLALHPLLLKPLNPCWATGLGTAHSLKKYGIGAAQIVSPPMSAPQFDSPRLWEVTKGLVNSGDKVLFIRGLDEESQPRQPRQPRQPTQSTQSTQSIPQVRTIEDPDDVMGKHAVSSQSSTGSQWLMAQLRQQGVWVNELEIYQRGIPSWSNEQTKEAIKAVERGSIWILSSSLSVQHLSRLLPHQDWSKARAIATHERIARTAIELGWGVVRSSRPLIADVLTSLEYFN